MKHFDFDCEESKLLAPRGRKLAVIVDAYLIRE